MISSSLRLRRAAGIGWPRLAGSPSTGEPAARGYACLVYAPTRRAGCQFARSWRHSCGAQPVGRSLVRQL